MVAAVDHRPLDGLCMLSDLRILANIHVTFIWKPQRTCFESSFWSTLTCCGAWFTWFFFDFWVLFTWLNALWMNVSAKRMHFNAGTSVKATRLLWMRQVSLSILYAWVLLSHRANFLAEKQKKLLFFKQWVTKPSQTYPQSTKSILNACGLSIHLEKQCSSQIERAKVSSMVWPRQCIFNTTGKIDKSDIHRHK